MSNDTNALAAMLEPQAVQVDVDLASRKQAFEFAARLLAQQLGLTARDLVEHFFERERLGSTALGCGVAIPHARVAGLREPCAAVLRLKSPIDYGGPDDEPVVLLIFMLVPQLATQEHLQSLAEITEMLSEPALRDSMLAASEAGQLYRALVGWRASARDDSGPRR